VTDISGTDAHGKPLYSRAYTYDPAGNPISLVATAPRDHSQGWWGGQPFFEGEHTFLKDEPLTKWTESYSYDAQGRLTKACMNASCSRYFAYSYDPVGNRTKLETRKTTTTYAYNAADELLRKTSGHSDVTNYSYDQNGNEILSGDSHYAYNLENELTQVTGRGDKTSYAYTGDGDMATRSTGQETTAYAWDTNSGLPEMAIETDTTGQGRSAKVDMTLSPSTQTPSARSSSSRTATETSSPPIATRPSARPTVVAREIARAVIQTRFDLQASISTPPPISTTCVPGSTTRQTGASWRPIRWHVAPGVPRATSTSMTSQPFS
jgi:YD repeat-containing protein